MKNVNLNAMLARLVDDFNEYSELVALNYAQQKEGWKDGSNTTEWNRGHLAQIEDYMKELAELIGVSLEYECKEHTFGFDDWKRELEYRTVSVKG